MNEYESLSHTTWDCKYHVVFIQKFRRKTLYLELRRHLGEVFHKRRLKSLIILKWILCYARRRHSRTQRKRPTAEVWDSDWTFP
jgi:hypothetical protein